MISIIASSIRKGDKGGRLKRSEKQTIINMIFKTIEEENRSISVAVTNVNAL